MSLGKILFISEMKDMKVDASSTQIMTYNLLYGLKEQGCDVTFLAVCNDACNIESVAADFGPIVSCVKCVPSALNLLSRKRSVAGKHLIQLYYANRAVWYENKIKALDLGYDYQMILTHLPAIESAFYARAIKRSMPDATYVQYWSDPYARSGLAAAERLPFKRYIMKILEKRILKKADRIVYGTPLLRETQAREFPALSSKMFSCDVSYSVYEPDTNRHLLFADRNTVAGYVGGYRSTYRNIDPLYHVFQNHRELGNLVLCGYSDVPREETENIRIMPRCSPLEAMGVEKQLDIHVCLLNRTMSQIPGKIFYLTNSGKPILVILDGPDKKRIREYLEKFERFEFSENTEEAIGHSLREILNGHYKAALESPEALSPKRFARSVIGL